MQKVIRWIPNKEIRRHAEDFLFQYWDYTLPVDVEYIAEYRLNISILPSMLGFSPALRAGYLLPTTSKRAI